VRLAIQVLLDLHLRIRVLRRWEATIQLRSNRLLVIMQLSEILVRSQRTYWHNRVAEIVI